MRAARLGEADHGLLGERGDGAKHGLHVGLKALGARRGARARGDGADRPVVVQHAGAVVVIMYCYVMYDYFVFCGCSCTRRWCRSACRCTACRSCCRDFGVRLCFVLGGWGSPLPQRQVRAGQIFFRPPPFPSSPPCPFFGRVFLRPPPFPSSPPGPFAPRPNLALR